MQPDIATQLNAVGPQLRELRTRSGQTLAELSAATGISASTLSRLEAGGRKPNLELLLPLARVYQVTIDELLSVAPPRNARVHGRSMTRHGMTVIPLTRRPGGLQAYKHIIAAGNQRAVPDPRTHEGYEWLYVLSGRLRMVLGDQDFVAAPGEAVEFDTRLPHWFGQADPAAVEFLSIFGPQGERMHLRARSTRKRSVAGTD